MLLYRAGARIATARCLRMYSTPANPYSHMEKLRAYPFAFDEPAARRYLAPIASLLCKDSILGSLVNRVLPSFNLPSFQPKRIVPVYFPAWIIDAEVQAKVRYHGGEKLALAQFQNGYLPGSDYPVVSTIPLFPAELQETVPLPWSGGLLNQQGQQINCLPFTIDPISGLKAFSEESFKNFPDLYFSLSSVEPALAVYRPILLPLYLAQYESVGPNPEEKTAFTLLMDASSNTGNIYAVRIETSFKDDWALAIEHVNKSMDLIISPDTNVMCVGPKNSWVDVETVSLPPARDISGALSEWIGWQMFDPKTPPKLAASSSPTSNWDPRIREYDVEDRDEVEQWMAVGAELMLVRRILDRINEQTAAIGEDTPAHLATPIAQLKHNQQELEEKREELMPPWSKLHNPKADE